MMKTRALLAALSLGAAAAHAEPRPARWTADLHQKGGWSFGLFEPLRIAVHERVELMASPLLFLVAPNLDVRLSVLEAPPPADAPAGWTPGLRLTVEVGLSLPTPALRLMKGFFFPSWETSAGANDIGWMLVPRAALVLSGNVFVHDVWTARLDGAFRVPLGPNSAAPAATFLTPLNIVLAAPLNGAIGRLGVAYDKALGDTFRLRAELNGYLRGNGGNLVVAGQSVGALAPVDPFIATAHLGLDIAVFQKSRLTVGVAWANEDTGETAVFRRPDGFAELRRVRSNNILPTVDFIWAGP